MSSYFTYATRNSYQRYVTLNYYPTFTPSYSNKYKSYAIINNDDKLEPSVEPTEFLIPTSKPTIMPTFIETQPLNYTCICKTDSNDNEKKIIVLIVATSLTSFSCVLLILFILWYRFIFKKKLMNKHQNSRLFFEKFGVELSDLNI